MRFFCIGITIFKGPTSVKDEDIVHDPLLAVALPAAEHDEVLTELGRAVAISGAGRLPIDLDHLPTVVLGLSGTPLGVLDAYVAPISPSAAHVGILKGWIAGSVSSSTPVVRAHLLILADLLSRVASN